MGQHPAWFVIVTGLIIAAVGVIWLIGPSIPWLGKLPGDISVERENFRFYFPVVTCIVVSLLDWHYVAGSVFYTVNDLET